jgi:two-component system sensor histidine kinase UhpB
MNTEASSLIKKILHLEDSELDHELTVRALQKTGIAYEFVRVETLEAFQSTVRERIFDVILADYHLPGFTALDAWAVLQNEPFPPPFILLSGAIGEPAAVSAIKMGMSDYLAKDELPKLGQIIRRAIELHAIRRDKVKSDRDLLLSEKRLAEFAEHLQITIENERAAIAREIHDDIGGSLAAAKFDLAWIDRHTTNQAITEHIKSASDMVQHALDSSQRIMMNLRPAILDQGLVAAVQWLASDFSKRTGIKTTLHADHALAEMHKDILLTAYRTVQEALTNISKYAKCDLVTIEISDVKKFLTVEIKDNGLGLSPSDLIKSNSFGLRGLHERAKSVDGWLDVSSAPGRGTALILSVPLNALAKPPSKEGRKLA